MAKVYVGNLPENITERDLTDEFSRFGTLDNVWVARKPPGFAFIQFADGRDADDACRKLDGFNGWRVEVSRSGGPRGGPRGGFGGGGGYGGGGGGGGGYGGGPPAGGRELKWPVKHLRAICASLPSSAVPSPAVAALQHCISISDCS